jgi:sugar lactone lactonase YvrE
MKRTFVFFALGAALVVALAAPAGATTKQARLSCASQPWLVASFEPGAAGSFAESLAADRHGNLFVSLTVWGDSNTGQIWRIARNGHLTLVASGDLGPTGMLSGLAFNRKGRLYVGLADFADPSVAAPGVLGVRGRALERTLTLPGGSFPNGLAFHRGWLYVSDSSLGAIWRARPGNGVTLSQPWLQDDLLLPGANGLGANGIAFWRDHLYIAVSDAGRVVRVAVGRHGSHGSPVVVTEQPDLLAGVDGVTFDAKGGLWMVVNTNAIFRLNASGVLHQLSVGVSWLDYPTQPVFGTAREQRHTLYVTNGSFNNGTPNVIAVKVKSRGAAEVR